MEKFTIYLKNILLIAFAAVSIGFVTANIPEETRSFIHQTLNNHFDSSLSSEPLKQFEINVTNNGFCRYRKVFKNGKQEFFAFNLSRFKTLDYIGTNKSGELYIRTQNDDVIVQTRNDRKGDVDSMATYIVIPVKDIDTENLNKLALKFSELAKK